VNAGGAAGLYAPGPRLSVQFLDVGLGEVRVVGGNGAINHAHHNLGSTRGEAHQSWKIDQLKGCHDLISYWRLQSQRQMIDAAFQPSTRLKLL
jgi:hypothetical protein